MPRFLVQNNRPRRTITLFGRLLAPIYSGGKGQMWLSEDQLAEKHVDVLLRRKRLVVLEVRNAEGKLLEKLPKYWEPGFDSEAYREEMDKPPLEPGMNVDGTPHEEPEEDEPVGDDDTPQMATKPLEEPPADTDTDTNTDTDVPGHTQEELEALNRSDLVRLAKEFNVKASGKSLGIIERILGAQAGGEG